METFKNHQGKIAEMLGMSLGQGLGTGVNTFFANKALDEVLQDNSMKDAPVSTRLGKIHSALSPYGEVGENLFKTRVGIEQQAEQEKQQILQSKEAKEKEQRLFQQQKDIQSQKDEAALERSKNRPPPGGRSAQPVDPETNKKIGEILGNSKNLNADQLKFAMDEAGIPSDRSASYVQNRRLEDQSNSKNATKAEQTASQNDIRFHEESKDFEESLLKEVEVAKRQIEIIDDLEKGIEKVKPSSLANVFKGLGTIGDKISNALISGKQAEIQAAIPEFLEGRKELFGVRLSDADLRLLQDKLPDIGKNPEANKAILNLMKKYANYKVMKGKAAENVLEKEGVSTRQGKLRPLNYRRKVDAEFDKLKKESEGTSFSEQPPAANHTGRIIKGPSGERLKSNGKTWEPV